MLTPLSSFSFLVDGRPRPKERPRLGRRGRVYTPVRTLQYERAVLDAASWCVPRDWPLNCQYSVEMVFTFKRGATPDIDNVAKAVFDGLNGVAWDDDRQVVQMSALRITGDVESTQVRVHRVSEALPAKRKARPKAPSAVASRASKVKRAPRRRGRS